MVRSVCIAAAWVLSGPACLGQSRPVPAESGAGLVARWQLTKAHVAGQMLRPLAGGPPGMILAPVAFAPEPPHALLLPGDTKAKHRIALSEDLPSADLPEKDITVEAWVRIDRLQQWAAMLCAVQDNGTYEKGWVLGTRERGERFIFGLAGQKPGRITYLTDERPLAPGMWYHVVGTYDGARQCLYVDGERAAEAKAQSGPIAYPPKGFYTLGAYRDDNELYPLAGQIEQVSLYRRAMTPGEVRQRFEARKRLFPDVEAVAEAVTDWPTYMHDARRSGATAEALSLPLGAQWVYHARRPPQPAWPPPAKDDLFHQKYNLSPRVTYDRAFHVVAVGGRVYFGSSADDKVYCLDAATGREVWTFYAEGPVRLAPTVVPASGAGAGNDALVIFGSDDGWVYCLKADGPGAPGLAWKHHLAPTFVRLPGNGRVVSLFPVRTGVVVAGGVARFCAGLFPEQGVYEGTVDVATGRLISRKQIQTSPQGYMQVRGGRLFTPTGRQPAGAWLDASVRRGKVASGAVVKVRADWPYAAIAAGGLHLAGGDGRVAAFGANDAEPAWSAKVEGKAYSLAVAGGRLLVGTDRGVIYCFAPRQAAVRHVRPPAPAPLPQDAAQERLAAAADRAVSLAGVRKGYCLVLGTGGAPLAAELARRTEMTIVCREPDAAAAQAARRALDAAGLHGRVVVHCGPVEHMPYTDWMFNLVVHAGLPDGRALAGSRAEVLRVLRPCGGVAVLGPGPDDVVRRGPLEGQGEWTHFHADAGNTACSRDSAVHGPMAVQWFGEPGPRDMVDRHNRTVTPLYKNGRVVVPGYDRVTAVDAYNGTVLWSRDLPDSVRPAALKNCGSMAVTDDVLYVAAGAKCVALDAATGEEKRVFSVPGPAGDWGYVAVVGDVLFGSQTKAGASRWKLHPTSWVISYSPRQPVVCSDLLFAHDAATGRRLWVYNPQDRAYRQAGAVVINPTLAVADGRLYFVESASPTAHAAPNGRATLGDLLGPGGATLVALDARTGKPAWRRQVNLAMQHVIFLSCAQGTVLITGSKTVPVGGRDRIRYDLHAFSANGSADAGEPLWNLTHAPDADLALSGEHGELTLNPVIVGGTVYVAGGAFDLRTGKQVPGWRWRRNGHGCGARSASAGAMFHRGTNPRMTDLKTGHQTVLTRVTRPGCWINTIPAGGLVLIPEASSGCSCPYPIQTSLALRPLRRDERSTARAGSSLPSSVVPSCSLSRIPCIPCISAIPPPQEPPP